MWGNPGVLSNGLFKGTRLINLKEPRMLQSEDIVAAFKACALFVFDVCQQ